jgi:hypothetical protein
MTGRRPRDIGTHAESAVVRAAIPYGFPDADRLALHGVRDRGDVMLCYHVVIEVKGGDRARLATDLDIDRWLAQTDLERINAGAAVGFLVVQRAGVGERNAHRWWAWWRLEWIDQLLNGDMSVVPQPVSAIPVRMLLGDALTLINRAGYGERA